MFVDDYPRYDRHNVLVDSTHLQLISECLLNHVSDESLRLRPTRVKRKRWNHALSRLVSEKSCTNLWTVTMSQHYLVATDNQISDLAHGCFHILILLIERPLLASFEDSVSAESDYDDFLDQPETPR